MTNRRLSRRIILAAELAAVFVLVTGAPVQAASPADQQFVHELDHKIETVKIDNEIIERLSVLIAKEPQVPLLRYLMGRLLERQGYENLAIEQYEKAVELDNDYYPAIFQLFHLGLRIRDSDLIENYLTRALKISASDGQRLLKIGMVLERYGRLQDAERIYEVAYRAPQRSLGVGSSLADLRLSQGRLKDALEAVQVDLKRSPADVRANTVEGKVLKAMGRKQEAAASFQRAFKASPCLYDAAYLAGQSLYELKRYQDSLPPALLSLVCRKRSKKANQEAKDLLVSIIPNVSEEAVDEAVAECARAMPDGSHERFFRFAMGDVFDRVRKYSRAVEQYRLGVEAPAGSPNQLLSRGLYRWALDEELWARDYRKAFYLYQEAFRLAPDDPEIKGGFMRLVRRLKTYDNDLASRFKDQIWHTWLSFTAPQRR
ncbi:MAG: tetratricopeptide repeat protein [Candidatus Melainabacteria bacterium]|nr:tetratricopeptide repeat protein [Candidatus Melainabacteria bacterium]